MNIDSFKSTIKGFARASHFKVSGLGTGSNFEFLCKASSIPASTVAAIEVPYMGRVVKVSGDRTFEDWTITVMNPLDFSVRRYFEDWVERLDRAVEHVGLSDPAQYKEDAIVEHLDFNGVAVAKYKLVGCFPTTIGAIELSWDANTEVETFDVTIAYDYFTRDQQGID